MIVVVVIPIAVVITATMMIINIGGYMNKKPVLKIFGDYCCEFALWNDIDHEILDGSEEQLLKIGVLPQTITILKAIVDVYCWEPSDREPPEEAKITYRHLIKIAKHRLDIEIGDKFNIVTHTEW